MMCLDTIEHVCGNCVHWDYLHVRQLPIYRDGKLIEFHEFAACMVNAVEADAGDSIAMMGADGHCRFHAAAFEAAPEVLAADADADYGVSAGIDFPATLNPSPVRAHVA